jgi:hypothetical protein
MNPPRIALSFTAGVLLLACSELTHAQDPPRFTVSGVIIRDGASMAWVGEPTHTKNKLVRVREGDQIGPYRVTSIQEDRVELTGPAGPVVVRLSASAPDMPAQPTTASTGGTGTDVTAPAGQPQTPRAPGSSTASAARPRPTFPGAQERKPMTPEESAKAIQETRAQVERIKAAGPKSSGFGMLMGAKPQ